MNDIAALVFEESDIDFDKYMDDIPENAKVLPSCHFRDAVKKSFLNPEVERGMRLPWRKATEFRFRDYEYTLWTGYNGHKKSMMLGFVMLGMVAQGQKVCIASLEMPAVSTLARMAQQYTGWEPTMPQTDSYFDWLEGSLWLFNQTGSMEADRMLAVIRYAIAEKGVDHFVIDSLMMCGIGEDDYNKQKSFSADLATISKDTGCHIHLVAHSRKPADGKEGVPSTKYGVAGSANLTNIPDNVIVVFQEKDESKDCDAMFIVEKQRNGKKEPRYYLNFDEGSLQFKGSKFNQKLEAADWSEQRWQ